MFIFNIDRGGTFTDFYVQKIKDNQIIQQFCFKVPSQSSKGEGPIVGIKQFLQNQLKIKIDQSKIPSKFIECVNIGTTIATNALLQRKGTNSLVIVSQGFQDILTIRNQTRPNIFDLKCEKPEPLTKNVLSIDSRLYLHKIPNTCSQLIQLKEGVYYQPPSSQKMNTLIENIKQLKPQSIGISLCNSYISPEAQNKLENMLQGIGIKIQKGSSYIDQGYLKRTQTVSLDCYLNPIMDKYFKQLVEQFDEPEKIRLRIMKSDGGFAQKQGIRASQLLLSGPAGGLIGYSKMNEQLYKFFELKVNNLVGLDMGGTSTDISKVKDNQIQLKYNFQAEGIQICTPHLQIETIAAGGGSKLSYFNGMFTVGPQSVGSNPGPVCYGIGQDLAITDANLLLNRLDVSFFPKVFGKNRNQQPNRQLSKQAFEKLALQINKTSQKPKTIYEIAEGYIQIANQLMAKSARKILTMGKPDALVVFGSAGGQHCCDIAQKIGVNHVIVHKFSGILSAYGLSKANQTKQNKVYLGMEVTDENFNIQQLKNIIESKTKQIGLQKLEDVQIIEQITIAYVGTSYSIKVLLNKDALKQFQLRHKQNNGFSLPNKIYKIQYYVKSFIKKPLCYESNFQLKNLKNCEQYLIGKSQVFLNGKFQQINKYTLKRMQNCIIEGPALMFSDTSSILIQQYWAAHIVNQTVHLKKIERQKIVQQNIQKLEQSNQFQFDYKQCDPIKLTIYSTRLMGIAQQMGKMLQKTSISTNIKQRLDFSCGIFDWNGHLLANAPHLPVHLGSMETAVVQQIKRGIKPGDVILANHPAAGGSHLPDLTVITCFEIAKNLNFYVASRGHHADIGGITPGSMPPFSRHLSQEGVAIQKFQLIKNGQFLQKQTKKLFQNSRRVSDNISDLLAQISANEFGIKLLKILIKQYGTLSFKKYVNFVCQNAKQSVQQMLYNFSESNNFPNIYSISNTQYMDDGTPLSLTLTIDKIKRQAIFDFTGTGPEVIGNTNAPRSITRSAVLYCLRSLLGKQIPLNSGCLVPIKFIIPPYSILSPSEDAAVVGGNVQTSQKLVDLILKPFKFVACSQGTMNNFLFGNEKLSYYQTICGGSGAGNGFSGTTTQCHMTNTRITDPEHLQKHYPVVLMKFKKRQNSGGPGQYKGGDGAIRQVMFLQEMEVSVLSERRIFSPYGLQGGQNGQTGKNLLITHDGIIKNIGSKNCFKVKSFDRVVINTPGGGGYGKF